MTAMINYSTLARRVQGVRDPNHPDTSPLLRKVFGACVHTTGRGVCEMAKRQKITPLAAAIDTYIDSQNGSNGYNWGGPHYLIDHDGGSHQLAPDNALTAHAGGPNRDAYHSGHWLTKVTLETVDRWRAKWPTYAHPYMLFPSRSPNHDYIGIEMIPIGAGFGGVPMFPGALFSRAQHDGLIGLLHDIGERHALPAGWAQTSRLVGHEDVDIIERDDSHGGWDPGWLRARPYFDFNYVREGLR